MGYTYLAGNSSVSVGVLSCDVGEVGPMQGEKRPLPSHTTTPKPSNLTFENIKIDN